MGTRKINNQATYSYDAMGNTLTARNGKHVYSYTDSARLASVAVRDKLKGEYSYNAQVQRVKKVRYTNAGDPLTWQYQYDQRGQLLSEAYYRYGGRLMYRIDYVWLGTQPIAQLKTFYRNNGSVIRSETLYLHTDHLNTPRSASDDSQRIVWRWDSDAFGETKADRDPDGDGKRVDVNLRFPGQYFDVESGLVYNWFRYYDPGTGRYVTSDPIGLNGGINTYSYVLNNPLYWTDPLGLEVLVGQHPAFVDSPNNPFQHAAVVFRPDNPSDFANHPLFQATGGKEATVGGQAFGPGSGLFGRLITEFNYPGDNPSNLNDLTVCPAPPGKTDKDFILDLIKIASSYNNQVRYDPFPDPWDIHYNSNSTAVPLRTI